MSFDTAFLIIAVNQKNKEEDGFISLGSYKHFLEVFGEGLRQLKIFGKKTIE